MNAGTFLKAIIFIAIIGGAYAGTRYYQQMGQAKIDMLELKSQLDQTLAFRDQRKMEWDTFDALQNKASQAAAKTTPLKKEKEEWDQKLKRSETEFKNLARFIRDSVDKVRSAASTQAFPEIKLLDGKVLKDVKIRKFEDGQLAVMHAEGIGSVPITQLPPDLLEKFDLGATSLTTAVTSKETDVFAGITRVGRLTLKCPVPLVEKPFENIDRNMVVEARQFNGKTENEMEVNVMSIRYAKGTEISLDGAVAGSLKSMISLSGMSNPRQQIKDTTISSFPAKRLSTSANRHDGEVYTEALYVYDGEYLRTVLIIYTNKSKGAQAVAASILASVQVEKAP